MAIQPINVLIQKRDGFEIVRDQIAQILANESANQMALAQSSGENPELWNINVYTERSIPWDSLEGGDHAVNVWFERSMVDDKSSSNINNQTFVGFFNIDVVVAGISRSTPNGHMPSDLDAATEAHRIARICRNIIMSPSYSYLGLRATENQDVQVGRRSVQAIKSFQPDSPNSTETIMGVRLELNATFQERAIENTFNQIQSIGTVVRDDQGRVLAEVDVDFTNKE